MAPYRRATRSPDEPQAQEEMTVFVFKIKGGRGSLEKGISAVTEALSALGPGPSNNRTIVPQKLQSGDGETIDAEAESLAEEFSAGEETPGSPNSKGKKPRAGYTVMDDFDLSPEGAPSLKEYCAAKDPQTDQDKFLVASAWLQTHGGADPFYSPSSIHVLPDNELEDAGSI